MCQRCDVFWLFALGRAVSIKVATDTAMCVLGAFDDFSSVQAAFEGVYGAFVNTDGFTVGEQKEIYAGIRIFEIAKMTKGVQHYVWSNLDYALKVGSLACTLSVTRC